MENPHSMKRNSVVETFQSIKRNSVYVSQTVQNRNYSAQYIAGVLATLCTFSVGLHFGWTSPSIPILVNAHQTSISTASWITSISSIGDLIGAPLGGYLCHKIGRKQTILLTTIPHLLSWFLIFIATHSFEYMLARLFAGIAEGACYIAVPMYIAEITEPEIRGIIGSCITLSIILGILTINILGTLLTISTTAIICAVIPIITLLTFPRMPESPYYLIIKRHGEAAKDSLRSFRNLSDVEEPFQRISNSIEPPAPFSDIFTLPHNRKAFIIAAFTRFFQQMTGLSEITYYLIPIFMEFDMPIPALLATIAFSCSQIISGVICAGLTDNYGRIPLLMFSGFGAGASLITVSIFLFARDVLDIDVSDFNLIPFFSVLLFTGLLGLGYTTLPTVLVSELFATNIKSKATVLIHFVFSFTLFINGQLFLRSSLWFVFGIYAFFAYAAAIFACVCIPETKGKSLEEIQQKLGK